MQQLILIIHVLVAISMVALILLQHGKGADAGASFGGGTANTMFGSQGAVPFLMKVTATLAVIFFLTSLSLNKLAAHEVHKANNSLDISPIPMTKPVNPLPVSPNPQSELNKIMGGQKDVSQ